MSIIFQSDFCIINSEEHFETALSGILIVFAVCPGSYPLRHELGKIITCKRELVNAIKLIWTSDSVVNQHSVTWELLEHQTEPRSQRFL